MKNQEHIGHNISDDERNKQFNIAAAMYGFADPAFRDKPPDDPSDGYSSEFGDGWELQPAPSTGLRRRAWFVAYHRGMEILVVVFTTKTRKTSKGREHYGSVRPMFKYFDCTLDMWDGLLKSGSTGKWLHDNYNPGSDNYAPTDKTDIEEMTKDYKNSLGK
jgi:hypothetical protein